MAGAAPLVQEDDRAGPGLATGSRFARPAAGCPAGRKRRWSAGVCGSGRLRGLASVCPRGGLGVGGSLLSSRTMTTARQGGLVGNVDERKMPQPPPITPLRPAEPLPARQLCLCARRRFLIVQGWLTWFHRPLPRSDMAERPFVHLHCHSHYSLLDGANRIPELVAHTKAQGMNALAMTDHGNLYGAIEFYRECKAAGSTRSSATKPTSPRTGGTTAKPAAAARPATTSRCWPKMTPASATSSRWRRSPSWKATTTSRASTRNCSPPTRRA